MTGVSFVCFLGVAVEKAVCTHAHPEARLCTIPLGQGLSLNLELSWLPVISSDCPDALPTALGLQLTVTGALPGFCM